VYVLAELNYLEELNDSNRKIKMLNEKVKILKKGVIETKKKNETMETELKNLRSRNIALEDAILEKVLIH
jgi:hypothetical protein